MRLKSLLLVCICVCWIGAAPPAHSHQSEAPGVSIQAENITLREALSRVVGTDCPIDPAIPDVPLALQFSDLSRKEAVRRIVAAARLQLPRVVFFWSNMPSGGIPSLWLSSGGGYETAPAATEDPGELSSPMVRIRLRYLSAKQVSYWLGGMEVASEQEFEEAVRGIPIPRQAFTYGTSLHLLPESISSLACLNKDNTIVLLGHPEGIRSFIQQLVLIDVPGRQFRVRATWGSASVEVVALQNTRARLADAAAREGFDLQVVGHLNENGSIEVTVEGGLTRKGIHYPVHSTFVLQPGTSGAVLTSGVGLERRSLWLRVDPMPPTKPVR